MIFFTTNKSTKKTTGSRFYSAPLRAAFFVNNRAIKSTNPQTKKTKESTKAAGTASTGLLFTIKILLNSKKSPAITGLFTL